MQASRSRARIFAPHRSPQPAPCECEDRSKHVHIFLHVLAPALFAYASAHVSVDAPCMRTCMHVCMDVDGHVLSGVHVGTHVYGAVYGYVYAYFYVDECALLLHASWSEAGAQGKFDAQLFPVVRAGKWGSLLERGRQVHIDRGGTLLPRSRPPTVPSASWTTAREPQERRHLPAWASTSGPHDTLAGRGASGARGTCGTTRSNVWSDNASAGGPMHGMGVCIRCAWTDGVEHATTLDLHDPTLEGLPWDPRFRE